MMIRFSPAVLAVLYGVVAPLAAQGHDQPEQTQPEQVQAKQPQGQAPAAIATPKFDRAAFVQWMKDNKAPAKVLETFDEEWKAGADSRITDRALRAIKPEYAAAAKLIDAAEPKGIVEMAKVLGSTKDPYVRAHARYFLARAFLDEDDPEGCAEMLAMFIRNDRGRSLLDPEAAFYYGYSLSLIPAVAEAILNLDAFLQIYADAPERYRANAADLLVELRSQWDDPLHQIADEMKYCERKLRKDKTGKQVETKQLEIVEKLTKMIEELEKQSGGGGAPKGNQIPNGPASHSALPGGSGRVGQLHGSRGLKDKWGEMSDRDRAKILNEVQAKLPDHLRVLIERYFENVNKKANR